jgi:FtsP/CotA-like multicopper oxidase with cupredoxin domain
VAHSPGKWLLHCHMLGHAAAGMITWIEILA